jgi:hypothetical protein
VVSLWPASSQSRVTTAALDYGRRYMVWSSGPTAQGTYVVPIGQLGAAVAQHVPPDVRQDVNVPDLVRRYGPRREVGLVILHGDFNSLPPDEGIISNGDVVVLVDVKSNRVLLLTGP